MKSNKYILCVILLSSLTLTTWGQTILSLDSCFTLALKNNKPLQSQALDEQKAKQVKMQLFTKYFPNIQANGGAYWTLDPILQIDKHNIKDPEARAKLEVFYEQYGNQLGLPKELSLFDHGLALNVVAAQPIFMGGKIVAGNKLAKMNREATSLQTTITKRDLLLDVEQNYWLIASLQAKEQTLQTMTQLIDTLHTIVSASVEAGVATNNDLLQVQLKKNEITVKRIQLDNGITLATRLLCQTIGLPYDTTIHTDTLREIELTTEEFVLPTEEQVQGRPETEQLKIQLKASKTKRYLQIADALPHILVMGCFSYGDIVGMDNDYLKSRYSTNGFAGVTVTVPLMGWWEAGHKIKEQSLNMQQAQLQYDNLTEKMLLQTYQAYDKVVETQALCKQYASSVATATENYRLYVLNYEAGRTSIAEVLQAQGLFLQATNDFTDAQIDFKMALRNYQAITSDVSR